MNDYERYSVQISVLKDTVWVHDNLEGSTVGRFGKLGVDIHNSVAAQMDGLPQCRLCTHGPVNRSDWQLFRDKALEFWGVVIEENTYNLDLLKD